MDPYQLPAHILQHLVSPRLKRSLSAIHFRTLEDLLNISPQEVLRTMYSGRGAIAELHALKCSILTDIGQYVAMAEEMGLVEKGSSILQKERLPADHILIDRLADRIPDVLQPLLDRHYVLTLQDLLLIGGVYGNKRREEMRVALAQCKNEFLGPVQSFILECRTAADVDDDAVLRSDYDRKRIGSMILVESILSGRDHLLGEKVARCPVATLLDVTSTDLLSNHKLDWSLPDPFEAEELRKAANDFVKAGRWTHMDFFLHDSRNGLA
ncbi:MAG: hypothetical protein K9J06_11315 [Flavobacteriales bacterium]|nr:hypothetical protein [Flavobacteriales bacterium]